MQGYDSEHEFTLIRTIDRLDFHSETLLFFSTYDVNPTSWEDARELSKNMIYLEAGNRGAAYRGPLPNARGKSFGSRTLTVEEEGRVK